jgi:putative transposase
MTDIMMVFACLNQSLHPTALRQLTVVAQALLAMTGRVTMLDLSRWAGKGGSYRTIQRFFNTTVNWSVLQWLLIRTPLWEPGEQTSPKLPLHIRGVDPTLFVNI